MAQAHGISSPGVALGSKQTGAFHDKMIVKTSYRVDRGRFDISPASMGRSIRAERRHDSIKPDDCQSSAGFFGTRRASEIAAELSTNQKA